MTPSDIKSVLNKIGGGANKRLGQHFLIDRATLEAMAEHAPCHPGSMILEIGPGLGVLTRALLEKGCDVIALERDRRFVDFLKKDLSLMKGEHEGVVIQGDAAELDWSDLVGDVEWSLVSNLPYSISSLALRKALWAIRPAEHVVVLVQREVAERVIAKDGKTSLLSLMVALSSESARIVRRVPAGAFFPPPKVESAILEIVPTPMPERTAKWGIEPEKIMKVAKAGFAHPRKKLSSNLVESTLAPKSLVEQAFVSLGFSLNSRAEDLVPRAWADLTKTLVSSGETSLDSVSEMV